MDIRTIAVDETSTLHLRDAADRLLFDAGQPVTVTVYGPGSKAHARAQAERSNRLIDKLKRKGKSNDTAEQKAEDDADFLAACTHSMAHIEYDGLQGQALFKAVYADANIGFIAEQVGKHLADWANFSKALPKS